MKTIIAAVCVLVGIVGLVWFGLQLMLGLSGILSEKLALSRVTQGREASRLLLRNGAIKSSIALVLFLIGWYL